MRSLPDFCNLTLIRVQRISRDEIIVAAVTTSAGDAGRLEPMLETAKSTTRSRPETVAADNAYLSEPNLEPLEGAN